MKHLTILILIFSSSFSIAQEIIYSENDFNYIGSPAILINDKVYTGAVSYGSNNSYETSIRSYDIDGNLLEKLRIDTNSSYPNIAVSYLQKKTDSSFYVGQVVYNGGITSITPKLCVYDTNFTLLNQKNFAHTSEVSGISCIIEDGTDLVVGGYALDTNFWGSVVIKYNSDSITDSLWINDHWVNNIASGVKFGSNYIFGHNSLMDEYLTIVSEDFNMDTSYRRSHPNDKWIRDFTDFVVSPNGNHLYAFGIYDVSAFAVFKYNEQIQEVRKDTFLSVWNRTNKKSMWSKDKFCDYRTADSIFMVGGMVYSDLGTSELTPDLKAPLQVVLTDTAGNFHWSRLVGDQDSAYYYPWTVAATPDGGALIFSSKYDHRHSLDPHYMLSVIKIQGNGDVLSEKEYPMASGKALEIFPNPVKDQLSFNLPENTKVSSFFIVGIDGKLVKAGEETGVEKKTINITDLNQGVYLISLSTRTGEKYLGRFIKE